MSMPYALIGVIVVGEFLVASSGLGYCLNFYRAPRTIAAFGDFCPS